MVSKLETDFIEWSHGIWLKFILQHVEVDGVSGSMCVDSQSNQHGTGRIFKLLLYRTNSGRN